jgi:hypothetical protein
MGWEVLGRLGSNLTDLCDRKLRIEHDLLFKLVVLLKKDGRSLYGGLCDRRGRKYRFLGEIHRSIGGTSQRKVHRRADSA